MPLKYIEAFDMYRIDLFDYITVIEKTSATFKIRRRNTRKCNNTKKSRYYVRFVYKKFLDGIFIHIVHTIIQVI